MAERKPETSGAKSRAAAPRRDTVRGVVLSARTARTIVVEAERLFQHPEFKKFVRRGTRYYAEDPKSEAREGDLVELVRCRPLSKLKRWRLVKVIAAAAGGEA